MNKIDYISLVKKSCQEIGLKFNSNFWVCKHCGQPDIDKRIWINLNTGKEGKFNEDTEYWCNRCRDETSIKSYNQYILDQDYLLL